MESKQISVVLKDRLVGVLVFIKLNWRKQLALGEEGIDLLNKLEGCVLLVEDQGIYCAESDRNLSAVEKKL